MKNGIRVAICVMLVVTVLAMSLSVFADNEPTPTPELDEGLGAVTDNLLSYYIWLTLRAWGINIQFDEMDGFYDEVESQIITWVIEYLAGLPSAYSINQWIAPWQGDFDYWGNLRLNNSALEDIQDFANWLITKLGLTNNGSIIVNGTETFSGVNLYYFDQYYSAVNTDGMPNAQYVAIKMHDKQNALLGYFYANIGDNWYLCFTARRPYYAVLWWEEFALTYEYVEVKTGENQAGSGNWGHRGNQNYTFALMQLGNNALIADGTNLIVDDMTEADEWLSTASVELLGDLGIITGTINLPDNDITYAPGDSITIIDGEPNYEVIEWDGHFIVDNLPAIVSTQTVSDPHLDTFWGFIPVLAEQTKDAIVLARGLIYELPEEIVVTFYAVMGGLILFGIIKLMREH